MNSTKAFTILLVDDDRDDQYMLKKIANSLLPEVTVVQAFNGDECLRYLEAHAHELPALITMDVNMPLVNGIEATEQIKRNHVTQGIPVVALSTSDRAADRKACLEAGANDYVVKPVVFDELRLALRDIFNKWLRS